MTECWADKLGNCSDTISKEHTITKGLVNEDPIYEKNIIAVYGYDWCDEKPKKIGISSTVSKILCKYHNNSLSILDKTAIHAFDIFRKVWQIVQNPKDIIQNNRRKNFVFSINGTLLERWFLKTVINVIYKGLYLDIEKPPLELIELAFGIKKFPQGVGLCDAGEIGWKQLHSDDDIKIVPIIKNDRELVMALCEFRGWKFALPLTPEPLPQSVNFIEHTPSSYMPTDDFMESFLRSQLMYHPRELRINLGDYITIKVMFQWETLKNLQEIDPERFSPWLLNG